MKNYDVIFIGSGHANWHAAVALKQAGKSIAIIEKDQIAGTCTNYGCDPKILLDGPFELLAQLKQYNGIGVTDKTTIDWTALMAYKHKVIDPLPIQMAALFNQLGIDVIMGNAQLVDKHTVSVNDQQISAENIVIGTGQRPAKLNIPGQEFLHNSRDFLNLEKMPQKIVFIGAGVISLEFATMANELGSSVEIVEFADHALGAFDQRHVTKLVDKLEQSGVKFHFNEAASQVISKNDHLEIRTNNNLQIETDYIIDATGRIPNIENIGLEKLGIKTNRGGIVVDDHLRTSVKNIYASGDVIDKQIPRLTPTATFESNYIAQQLLGSAGAINYPAIPSVVFSLPRLAQIGITSAAASESEEYHTQVIPYGKQLLFQYKNEIDAELTLILDKNNYLVGANIYGNDAPDLINLITMIIDGHLSANKLDEMVFAFPSASIGVISLISIMLHRD